MLKEDKINEDDHNFKAALLAGLNDGSGQRENGRSRNNSGSKS